MSGEQAWAYESLNLCNLSYLVSNQGREIRFTSPITNEAVILYPTTGTFIVRGKSHKADIHRDGAIEDNIRICIKRYIRTNF